MVLVLKKKNKAMDRKQPNRKPVDSQSLPAGEPENTQKEPDNWATGNESMTGAQRSYLRTLSQEAGENIPDDLTKAEASKKIDELQKKTGRGLDH